MEAESGTGIDFWRQTDLVTPDELPAVTVIGAGGIGSFTLLALAKMGVKDLTAIDPDMVERHNIPNQLYGEGMFGNAKVAAAKELCEQLASVDIYTYQDKFDDSHAASIDKVVVSGVDSMASRKEIWALIKGNAYVDLYIEARMGAEVSRINSINPCNAEDVEWYETTLYDDKDAMPEPCTARAIIYNGFAIAALIASQVKKWAKQETVVKEIIFDMKTLTLVTQ
jgi:hypothetical protein